MTARTLPPDAAEVTAIGAVASPPPGASRTEPDLAAAAAASTPPGRGPAEDDRTLVADPALGARPGAKPVHTGVLINNNYRVQQMLSQGGMGEVYRAENVFTGDPVALKIVLPSLARDHGIIDLFMREARILGQLTDDAIVRYLNFVLDPDLGRYCLIMEFIDGTTLWDHVDVHGPIRAGDALRLIRRLAEGLAKAHARGVTHRDLSPDNVMLRGDDLNQPVLIDFGIARAADMGEGMLAGRFAGKFKYIAPEQLGHFGGEVGPQADIYGMALMIAAVLRGRPLDMGGSAEEATAARQSIPDLGGIPHEVYPLLQYMLEPDPAHRPPSMEEVAAMAGDAMRIPLRYRHPLWGQPVALEAVAEPPAAPAAALSEPAAAPRARAPAHRWLWPMAALALGAVGIAVMVPRPPAPGEAVADARGPSVIQHARPVELPPRDPATREGFLAGADLPGCTQVHRIESGLDTGKLLALADSPRSFDPLLDGYEAAFSARPAILSREVARAQCPALDFVRGLQGRGSPAPILTLDGEVLASGGTINGRVTELRGRPLWLALVGPDGRLHDLSPRLVAQPDGSATFTLALEADGPGPEGAPQVILALASAAPLLAPAAAGEGAPAADLLPRVLDEVRQTGGGAAADIATFVLRPAAGG